MDQVTINIIATAVLGCLSWFARMLHTQLREQEKQINELNVMIARDYVSNHELTGALQDIKKVVQDVVSEFRNDITHIRARVDSLPRRTGD